MAEPAFQFGAIFGHQADIGVADPAIVAATGALTPLNGVVLLDPDAGIGGSGIDFSLVRNALEKVKKGFTPQISDFVSRGIDTFTVTVPARGMGRTPAGSPTPATVALDPGYSSLFSSAGLKIQALAIPEVLTPVPIGQSGTVINPLGVLTAKLWFMDNATNQSIAFILKNIETSNLSMSYTGGERGSWVFSMNGTVDDADNPAHEETFPDLQYGVLASTSTPVVQDALFTYGGTTPGRGAASLVVNIDNANTEVEDVSAGGGQRQTQDDRNITFSGTVYGDDDQLLYEYEQLGATSLGQTSPIEWKVGDVATDGAPALGHIRRISNFEFTQITPSKMGAKGAWDVEGKAISDTQGGEYELLFI
jgi:hypothetical protein